MYKICICSGGHPRETFKVFSKLQGLHYQFRCNLALYESEFFFIPLPTTFLNLKILGFLFPSKIEIAWPGM